MISIQYDERTPGRRGVPVAWLVMWLGYSVAVRGEGVPLATEPPSAVAEAKSAEAAGDQRLRDSRLMVHFQGKGSALPYDGGVIQRAYPCLPALRDNRVVLAGDGGGSILAAYFSCVGFSRQSVDYAVDRLKQGDETAIHGVENIPAKAAKMMRGLPIEIPHLALKEYIAFALGVEEWRSVTSLADIARRSRYVPRHPVVIVAANKEVLDNLVPGTLLEGQRYKSFDVDNFSVSWKPDVWEFYRRHPQRFAQEHPDLRLGPDPYIGKACTYFVDQTMFDLLRRIPDQERLADLRLMTTPADLILAIVASAAEPTYFPPIEETDYDKLLVGDQLGHRGLSQRRQYCGGYVMSLVGQDVRRMLPDVRVLGTGWIHLPHPARELLEAQYLIDMEPVADLNSWWADMEITPRWEIQKRLISRKLTAQQEYDYGWETATQCLTTDRGLPQFVAVPKYHYPAPAALSAREPVGDSYEETSAADPDRRRLKTLRGLGPLLDPSP